jgi:DNA-binding IclR family transcriptional regulator
LASLPTAQAMAVIRRQGLARVTSRTITSRQRFLAELRRVRRNGYATTDEELDEGGRAIAAPILHGDAVVGAIAVSGPSFRLPLTRLAQLAPRVQQAARELQALWPHQVMARDFGLAVRLPGRNGRVSDR